MHEDAAREAFGSDDVVKLASNESPWGPHPAVIEAVAGAAKGLNRYPDQHARRLRRRIAERFDTDPARVAVGNGSCEILLAAAEALCEPGDEILFAWPSFSIYPHLAALSGAREIRVPLADGYVHDLDAMLAEVTAATQLVCVCNPNNPTGTHLPAEPNRGVLRPGPRPRHGGAGRGLHRVPDQRRPRRHRRPAGGLPEPGRPADVQQGARAGRPALRLRAVLGQVPRRRSTPCASRSASTSWPRSAAAEAILHADDVAERVERTIVERVFVEEGVRELGLRAARLAGQLLLDPARRSRRGRGDPQAGRAGRRGPRRRGPRRPGPHPRHLRHARRERALPRAGERCAAAALELAICANRPAPWYKPWQ